MAKVLSFETIPHFYWKNDKGIKPANGIQPAFCGDFIIYFTSRAIASRLMISLTRVQFLKLYLRFGLPSDYGTTLY